MQRPPGSWVGGCCGWAGGLAGRAHAAVGWPGGYVRRSEAFGWRRGRAKERRTTDRPRFEAGEIMGGWTPTHLPTQIHMHDPIENSPVFQCFSRGGSVPVFFPGASSTIWAAFSSRQWEFLGRSRFLMFLWGFVIHIAGLCHTHIDVGGFHLPRETARPHPLIARNSKMGLRFVFLCTTNADETESIIY